MDSSFLMQLILSVVVATVSAFLAAHLSVRRFYTEKWWERKENAYTEIINALYDMVEFYEIFKEDYGQEDFISDQESQRLHERHSEGYKVVRRAAALAVLYIPTHAVEILSKLNNREVLDYYSNPLWDIYETEYQYYSKALDDFIDIAIMDLQGKNKYSRLSFFRSK